jgi:hypothetical protein
MDRVALLELRGQAFRKIREDDGLWEQWHECKTEHDRELLMTWAISKIVYARGFDDGYYDGWSESEQTQY